MSYTKSVVLISLVSACLCLFSVLPVPAFTANSLDITVQENGDALATFRFTLEGFIENAIPQPVLEEELVKGLTTSADPPELKSMDRSSAVLIMKKFADTSDVPTGTEYRTATMDFKKAEAALQNSALSGAVSADFSPATITLAFPDSYQKQFSNVDVLPAVFHTIEDPVKVARLRAEAEARAQAEALVSPGPTAVPPFAISSAPEGSINVSSSPGNVSVSIDSRYIGEAPELFSGIAAGDHIMEFSREGYVKVSKSVLVNPGKTTNILVVLTPVSSPAAAVPEDVSTPSWIPLLIVIIGIIVLGAGGYIFWMENEKKRKAARKAKNGGSTRADAGTPATVTVTDDRASVPEARKPETLKFIDDTVVAAGRAMPDAEDAESEGAPAAGGSLNNGGKPEEMPTAGPDNRDAPEAKSTAERLPAPAEDDTGDECR